MEKQWVEDVYKSPQYQAGLLHPFLPKQDYEDKIHVDDDEFYNYDSDDSLYGDERITNTHQTLIKFLHQVRESRGYDVDIILPPRFGSRFRPVPLEMLEEDEDWKKVVMAGLNFAMDKINEESEQVTGKTYEFVELKKFVDTRSPFLYTFTAKVVNDDSNAVKTLQAMVYPPLFREPKFCEWRVKPVGADATESGDATEDADATDCGGQPHQQKGNQVVRLQKKVPILMVDGEQLVDSSDIINKMTKMFHPDETIDSVAEDGEERKWRGYGFLAFYQLLLSLYEIHFSLLPELHECTLVKLLESYHSRLIVLGGQSLSAFLAPNIYRTTSKALESFEYITTHGGTKPNLADLAVYGFLRPIRYLKSGRDMAEHMRIGDWYSRMETAVGLSSRIQA